MRQRQLLLHPASSRQPQHQPASPHAYSSSSSSSSSSERESTPARYTTMHCSIHHKQPAPDYRCKQPPLNTPSNAPKLLSEHAPHAEQLGLRTAAQALPLQKPPPLYQSSLRRALTHHAYAAPNTAKRHCLRTAMQELSAGPQHCSCTAAQLSSSAPSPVPVVLSPCGAGVLSQQMLPLGAPAAPKVAHLGAGRGQQNAQVLTERCVIKAACTLELPCLPMCRLALQVSSLACSSQQHLRNSRMHLDPATMPASYSWPTSINRQPQESCLKAAPPA
jgi:hypothetical protein